MKATYFESSILQKDETPIIVFPSKCIRFLNSEFFSVERPVWRRDVGQQQGSLFGRLHREPRGSDVGRQNSGHGDVVVDGVGRLRWERERLWRSSASVVVVGKTRRHERAGRFKLQISFNYKSSFIFLNFLLKVMLVSFPNENFNFL